MSDVDARQFIYRFRKNTKGLKRAELWVTKNDGILASRVDGKLPEITENGLSEGLKSLGFEDAELGVVYNEMLEYARFMESRLKKAIRPPKKLPRTAL